MYWKTYTSVEFPKPGFFCKTGYSVLGKVETGFRVRFWKSCTSLRSLQIGGGRVRGGVTITATLLTELLLTLIRRSKRAFNLPPCLPGIE